MHKKITSIQNPVIRKLLLLQRKSRARKKEGLFVIEGVRETELAIKGGYELQELFFCAELFSEKHRKPFEQFPMTEISLEIYQKIAYRGNSQGIIAVAKTKTLSLENIRLTTKNPLILVAEFPEKPGNIGAILRTADAAAVDAVLIAEPKTDLYNPNVVRSSVGCVFTNQIAVGSTSEIISFLKAKETAIFSAILQESKPYTEMDFTGASAIAMGAESTGLSEAWRMASTANIHIPMNGKIDSMNVSVAAGILVFEAVRQRVFF